MTALSRVLIVTALLSSTPSQASAPADWGKVRTLEGELAVTVQGAESDAAAKPLVRSSLDSFVLHARFRLSPSPGNPRLFKGRARGQMMMSSRANVLGGEVATGSQTCAGTFADAEMFVELLLDEQEYQLGIEGSVPNGKVSVRYPLHKYMGKMLGAASRVYAQAAKDDAVWQDFADDTRSAQQDFEGFARDDDRTEEVTFSLSTVPEFRQVPGSKIRTMKFLPLPSGETRIQGSGLLQLSVSTAMAPTVLKARTSWSIRGR